MWRRSRSWARYEAINPWQERDAFCLERPVYWQILRKGETVDSTLFGKQLEEMETREGQDKILLLMDNVRPHHAKIIWQKLEELEMKWLPHSPYSPDISTCDFVAFRSLESFWRGLLFKNCKDVKFALRIWILTRPQEFWRREHNKFQNDGEQSRGHAELKLLIKILNNCHYLYLADSFDVWYCKRRSIKVHRTPDILRSKAPVEPYNLHVSLTDLNSF